MTTTTESPFSKNITEMKISDLYRYSLQHPRLSHQDLLKPTFNDLEQLSAELNNTKNDLVLTKKELINSTNIITGLSKDLSKNRDDLQQSRIEVQQSRLENQQTRLELLNFKNDSKHVIENLNNKLDELIRINENNLNNFYQNIVNNLDEHFNSSGKPVNRKKRKIDATNDEEADADDASSVSSTSSTSSSKKAQREPMYRLIRGTDSIAVIWEEYIHGVNGGPSVKELEEKYQYRWRDDKERSILGHRKRIYAMIEKAIENGREGTEAAEYLDKYLVNEYGEKRSFAWLFENVPDGFK